MPRQRIGYARVSTNEQNLDLQQDALNSAGCREIYTDQCVSGADAERNGLEQALAAVGAGDVLIVWRLDRLGRSLAFLIALIDTLGARGAGFQSLHDGIDTTTCGGRLVFHIMGALAEFERSLIAERTRAGMAAARQRGQHIGRPCKLSPGQIAEARALLDRRQNTATALAARYGVHVATLRRALRARKRSKAFIPP